jgi:phosphoserine aminotransferase
MLDLGPDGAPSVLELSHRGPRFMDIATRLRSGLRELLGLSDAHEVLLMAGGAQQQFALLPMNLAAGGAAAYVESGYWSKLAIAQAQASCEARVLASSAAVAYASLPEVPATTAGAAYLHYCGNETIHGVQFEAPPVSDTAVIADLSSEICSRPYPFAALDGFYASAQKNLGIPGLTLVVLKRTLLERVPKGVPSILSYRAWSEAGSMPNTPTTAAWIACLEVVEWIQAEGGLDAMATRNARKAERLYACLDRLDAFEVPVAHGSRSRMNVVFRLKDRSREAAFLKAATDAGFWGLDGHRAVGGMRASLYNAVSLESVDALVDFLERWAANA